MQNRWVIIWAFVAFESLRLTELRNVIFLFKATKASTVFTQYLRSSLYRHVAQLITLFKRVTSVAYEALNHWPLSRWVLLRWGRSHSFPCVIIIIPF